MKQLRILTGRHAGVHVNLSSTRYVIGADDMADIQLLDWLSDPVVLEVGQDDMISIAATPQHAGDPLTGVLARFEDFLPRRFGDIVLCIGTAGALWPSDIDLIARLTQRVPQPAPETVSEAATVEVTARKRLPRRLASAAVGTVLVTAALGAAVAHLNQGTSNATQPAVSSSIAVEPLKTRIARAVSEMSLGGIEVAQGPEGVVVRGLLDGASEAQALRRQLDSFAPERVVHAYASAPEIAQSIAESLAQPGLKVSYRGQGAFVVSGQAANVDRVRETAERVAADLAPLVQRIEVAATALPSSDHAPLSALLSSEGLQYVQTRDGVKHLSLSSVAGAHTTEAPTAPSR